MNINDNKTLLLTTHYIEEAEILCDEVAIIDDGEIIAQGSPNELIESDGESHINITIDKWDKNILNDYEISYKDNMLNIKSKNTERDIPNIINELSKSNISIHKLDINKANLEDVFIKLTGKKITDDK
jgi:ABC-2 type transport system ATP-binding protein